MSTTTWHHFVLLMAFATSACADFGMWPHCWDQEYSVLEPGFLIYFTEQGTRYELFLRDCRKELRSTAFLKMSLPTGIYIARNYFTNDDFTTFQTHCPNFDDFPLKTNDDFEAYAKMKVNMRGTWFQHGCLLEQNKRKHSYAHALRNINLANNSLGTIDDPNIFVAFKNLEIINLSYNYIDCIHENTLKALTRIQKVNLEHNSISTFSVNLFNGLGYLKAVDLSNNFITHVVAGSFAGSALETLNLSRNRLTFLPDNFFSSLHSLKRFYFEYNYWQCVCLGELLDELKRANIKYSGDTFNGRIQVCVAVRWQCIRPSENVQQTQLKKRVECKV